MGKAIFCPIDFKRYLEKYLDDIKTIRICVESGNVCCYFSANKMYMSCCPNVLFIGDEGNSVSIYNVSNIIIDSYSEYMDNITIECECGSKYFAFAEKIL